MTEVGGDLGLPEKCIEWCGSHSYEYDVLCDMAAVDLDWWNDRLNRASIPARLHARTSDGDRAESGIGYVRREDLRAGASTFGGVPELSRLYLCVAWLVGNHARRRAQRFPDVRDTEVPTNPLRPIMLALRAFERSPALVDIGPQRDWSGWPHAPGIGPTPMSLYAWAVCSDESLDCPQLVDQQGLGSLVYHGWVQNPAIGALTLARYREYCEVLAGWARQLSVRPELVEHWLAQSWRQRRANPMSFPDRFRQSW